MQSNNGFLSHEQCLNAIVTMGDTNTILIEGENGTGKTALQKDLVKHPKFAHHVAPEPIDCTQLSDGSIWMPYINLENGTSCEFPNERFGVHKGNHRGLPGSRPVLVVLDEVLKAPQYIKNVLAPIMYERRLGNFFMPEGSVVVALTNLSLEGLGDVLQPHLRNRIMKIKKRKPTATEWIKWAAVNNIAPSVMAFVQQHDKVMHSFMDYEPGGPYHTNSANFNLAEANPYIFNPRAEQDGYASPRSLAAASNVVHKRNEMDDDTLEALLCGAIGVPAAQALASFVRFEKDMPDYQRIINDPEGAPLVDNPTAQIVQVMQFSTRPQSRDEAQAVTEYVTRMSNTMQTMFCNIINNSGKVALFCTVAPYRNLMTENHIYL